MSLAAMWGLPMNYLPKERSGVTHAKKIATFLHLQIWSTKCHDSPSKLETKRMRAMDRRTRPFGKNKILNASVVAFLVENDADRPLAHGSRGMVRSHSLSSVAVAGHTQRFATPNLAAKSPGTLFS